MIYPWLGTVIFCCTFLAKQYLQTEHVLQDGGWSSHQPQKTVAHCCFPSYPPPPRAIQLKISSVEVQTLTKENNVLCQTRHR